MHGARFQIVVAALAITACSSSVVVPPTPQPTPTPNPTPETPQPVVQTPLQTPSGTTVPTDKGAVVGKQQGATRVFLGIPYAAPPVGELRWKSPQPAAPWVEARDATQVGPICTQLEFGKKNLRTSSSEDCLTANVWTPAEPRGRRPVMVWIHGGAFVLGSGSHAMYDGSKLSEAGQVVVVTFNYRLGALGFLAHRGLRAENSRHPASGNFGLEDQQLLLRWVKNNIAAFGGDPENVTIFGESAGAISACLHAVMPSSRGLFSRLILESGNCLYPMPAAEATEAQGELLAQAVGCTQTDATQALACLRAKPVGTLLRALRMKAGIVFGPGASWGPSVDGVTVREQPYKTWRDGGFAQVPTLLGTVADEGTFFAAAAAPLQSDEDYLTTLRAIYGPYANFVASVYPTAAHGGPRGAFAAVLGDALFVCPARRLARLSSRSAPTFLYSFRHAIDYPPRQGQGTFHGSELGFVFGTAYLEAALRPDEHPLSSAMQSYFTQFAETGDPNHQGLPAWPRYDAAQDQHQVLDLQVSSANGLAHDKCDLWDKAAP